MKVDSKKLTSFCGFLGPAIIIIGSLTTAMLYRGRQGGSYSILNQYISKLGEVGVSRLAHVFNHSLIIGGLVLVIFVLGLGLNLRTKLGYVASAFGIFSSICCSLVGVFPLNNFPVHNAVATSFFFSGLIAIALFNVVILFDPQSKMSKWLLIPGIITVASFASFLIVPHSNMISSAYATSLHSHPIARPYVRLKPFLEWTVFFSVMAWFILMSISLIAKNRIGAEKIAEGES
jgi:hypothetical membrane protein